MFPSYINHISILKWTLYKKTYAHPQWYLQDYSLYCWLFVNKDKSQRRHLFKCNFKIPYVLMLVLRDETWQIKGPDFPLYIDYLLSFIFMHFNMWYLHLGSWEPERIQAAILGSRLWTSHSLGIWHFGSAFPLCKQLCISDEVHVAFKHAQAVLSLSSSPIYSPFPSKKKKKNQFMARNS